MGPKGLKYYRFHKPLGRACWSRYVEYYQAPPQIENTKPIRFPVVPGYRTYKNAMKWHWELPKGIAKATSTQEVLDTWVYYRHKRKQLPHYYLAIKRLCDVKDCKPGDWRLELILSRVRPWFRKIPNLPRLANYYARLNLPQELEAMARFIYAHIQELRYTKSQVLDVFTAFARVPLKDSFLLEIGVKALLKVSQNHQTPLQDLSSPELLKFSSALARLEHHHYAALAEISREHVCRNTPLKIWAETTRDFASLKFRDLHFLSLGAQKMVSGRPDVLRLFVLSLEKLGHLDIDLLLTVNRRLGSDFHVFPLQEVVILTRVLAQFLPAQGTRERLFRRVKAILSLEAAFGFLEMPGLEAAVRFMCSQSSDDALFYQRVAQRMKQVDRRTPYDVGRLLKISATKEAPLHLIRLLVKDARLWFPLFEPADFMRVREALARLESRHLRLGQEDLLKVELERWADKRRSEF